MKNPEHTGRIFTGAACIVYAADMVWKCFFVPVIQQGCAGAKRITVLQRSCPARFPFATL